MPLNTIESAELEDEALELEDEVLELADETLANEDTAFELSELESSAPEEALEKAWLFPPPPPQADNIRVTHTNFMLTRQARFKYTVKTPRMSTPQYV
ncbi:MAG TPA: hypothetical protein PK002_09925 [Cellvibrio sp.]|nr:hypothetical protein [Cellvibrio sp.]